MPRPNNNAHVAATALRMGEWCLRVPLMGLASVGLGFGAAVGIDDSFSILPCCVRGLRRAGVKATLSL